MMWRLLFTFTLLSLGISYSRAQSNSVLFTTLNCYWFFGKENAKSADKPRSETDYRTKAENLIGLLPTEAPLFVALQEIGDEADVAALARAAQARYKRSFRPLFVQGKDAETRQDVGALLDSTRGWGVYRKPSRASELRGALSKHLVLRLTNDITALDICVVHLAPTADGKGESKQLEQNRALLKWTMGHLSKNSAAKLMILGDFHETKPVGDTNQSLAMLFQARPPLVDTFSVLKGRVSTHNDGRAYDRIMVSNEIARGTTGLRFAGVVIRQHRYGAQEERHLYTDHFPVTAGFTIVR
jgi:endonuclease/exonuclease/phosphatase family metal-dependent hydrolase